ncbi:hypothetical protein U9M48_010692, partial [Paspalum notatum var. saurae]
MATPTRARTPRHASPSCRQFFRPLVSIGQAEGSWRRELGECGGGAARILSRSSQQKSTRKVRIRESLVHVIVITFVHRQVKAWSAVQASK